MKMKNIAICLATAILLWGCAGEPVLTDTAAGGRIVIGLGAEVEEGDYPVSRAATTPERFAKAWCVVADAGGKVFAAARHSYNSGTSELIVESLPAGSYTIAVLATSDPDAECGKAKPEFFDENWISSPESSLPVDKPWFYKRFPVTVTAGQEPASRHVALERRTGRVDVDIKYTTPFMTRFVKSVKVTLDDADAVYSGMDAGGEYTGHAGIASYDITGTQSFQSLPSRKELSGRIEIVSAMDDNGGDDNLLVRDYRFTGLSIEPGKVSRLKVDYIHPEMESGMVYLRRQDIYRNPAPEAVRLDTMFLDREPQSLFYDASRRGFHVNAPLRADISADGNLVVRLFAPVTLRDVRLYCRFNRLCSEMVELARFDEIYPFMEASVRLPMATAPCVLNTGSGRRIRFPRVPAFETGDFSIEIRSEDPYLKKTERIRHHWYIAYSAFSANNPNPGNWANMTPRFCRIGAALIVNMAYMFSSQDFKDALKSLDGVLKDDGGNPIVLDDIHKKILNISNLYLGRCRNVGGLGGGTTYGLADYCYLKCFYDNDPGWIWNQEPIFHEFGHILGYGHSSNMTYGAWPEFCVPKMFEMQRNGELPVNSFFTVDNLPR